MAAADRQALDGEDFLHVVFRLRKQYRQVFYLKLPDAKILYRPLTAKEFKVVVGLTKEFHPSLINDLIIEMAVLYTSAGRDWLLEKAPGGLADQIADKIIEGSKFGQELDMDYEMAAARAKLNEFDNMVAAFAMRVFPTIDRKTVQDLTHEEQMTLLAQAEAAIGGKQLQFGEKKRRRPHKLPEMDNVKTPSQDRINKFPELLSSEAADTPDI